MVFLREIKRCFKLKLKLKNEDIKGELDLLQI